MLSCNNNGYLGWVALGDNGGTYVLLNKYKYINIHNVFAILEY